MSSWFSSSDFPPSARLVVPLLGPISKRSRKVFGPVKPQLILNLTFTELFFSHNFNTNKFNFHAKFNAHTLLSS